MTTAMTAPIYIHIPRLYWEDDRMLDHDSTFGSRWRRQAPLHYYTRTFGA
jgi:hypothetical protein